MLEGDLVLIWELEMNLVLTLLSKYSFHEELSIFNLWRKCRKVNKLDFSDSESNLTSNIEEDKLDGGSTVSIVSSDR